MEALFELLIKLISYIPMVIYCFVLLFVVFISVVYIWGYVYDTIFGNCFINLGRFLGRKCPKIKGNPIVIKLWKKVQPKELYLRYETPVFTYCCSYTAISFLSLLVPNENGMGIITASILYLFFYFAGMARRCGKNKQYYKKILDNNMDFLKLSFLPLGFIITVLGFCFTITGMKVQELSLDYTIIKNAYTSLMSHSNDTNIFMLFLESVVLLGALLILFYIISLPIQVIAYFIISVIYYFRKYQTGYVELLKKYKDTIVCFF